MNKTAKLELDGTIHELPIIEGTEKEKAIDISSLRNQTGYITLDDGYANTGSCRSKITFIDGRTRYPSVSRQSHRGPAEKSTFIEVAYLLI